MANIPKPTAPVAGNFLMAREWWNYFNRLDASFNVAGLAEQLAVIQKELAELSKPGIQPVKSVNGKYGAVILDAGDVGADPAGTADAAVAAHIAAADPHPQYTTEAEAAAAAPVQSVNMKTGDVVLDASDVGADPAGSASSAVSAHVAAPNPHPQYATAAEVAAAITAQKGVANGLATLDAGAKLPANQLPALAITDTFVVASQAAMLALTAERGDVAVRTDLQKSFILAAEPATTLANWQELLVPTGTAGTVTSVALSVPTGLVVAGSPITTSGTFTVTHAAGYQGYTTAEATRLSGIAAGATVGATWGTNLSGIPANITSWAGIAPSTKENAGVAVAKNVELNIIDPALTLWRITAGTSPGADYQSILIDTGLVSASRGAYFRLFGSNHASAPGQVQIISGAGAPIIMSGGVLRFNADNTYAFGAPSFRASVLYAGTGTINTSDAREKTPVRPFTPAELAAAAELGREIGVYQWLAMIAEKGEAARQHIGMTVQRAIEILRSHGLDPFAYGFICYDEWDELPEVIGEDGEVAQEYRAAGDRYSFRMDELLAFIARGLAHRLDSVEQRLAAAGL